MSSRRAPKGFTYDPCPGCDLVHDFQPRVKAGVCASCREVLNAHSRAIAEASAQGLVAVGVPPADHWLPYISNDKHNVRKLFHSVAMAVSVPSAGQIDFLDETRRLVLVPKGQSGKDWGPYRVTDFRVMPSAVAMALRTLYEGLSIALPAAYEDGKSTGSNLLAMLNAGELTNADFERRSGTLT